MLGRDRAESLHETRVSKEPVMQPIPEHLADLQVHAVELGNTVRARQGGVDLTHPCNDVIHGTSHPTSPAVVTGAVAAA